MITKKDIETYLKGLSMGLADIIPGVSGGTIAFIVGIYEKLITSIKSFTPLIFLYLLKAPFSKESRKEFLRLFGSMNPRFLLALLFGIITSFLAASRVILIALHNFPTYTYAFFFGLILASAVMIYEHVEGLNIGKVFVGFAGFLFSFMITGPQTLTLPHTIPVVFFSGMIAISAMILPGISGSFMMLLLGQYEFMLGVLKNFTTKYVEILVFIGGAAIGLVIFSRILSYLLKEHKQHTVSFLTGLMLGALRLPFLRTVYVFDYYPNLVFS
ncbi:MAG: DUF368 domain-containing protein, partial [Candidatus Aenigmatarchaeota archaeon]